MTKDYKTITDDISAYSHELRKIVPDAMNGFSALAKGATTNGALDKKTKEFVALGIGIAKQCDGCIGFHVKTLENPLVHWLVTRLPNGTLQSMDY